MNNTVSNGSAFGTEEDTEGTGVGFEHLQKVLEMLLVLFPITIQETHAQIFDHITQSRNLAIR